MRVQTATEFGHLIRDRRRRLGLGQQELADRVGVGRQWLSEVEHGKPRAEIDLVLRTLRALGVMVDLRDIPEPPPDAPDINAVVAAARRPLKRSAP